MFYLGVGGGLLGGGDPGCTVGCTDKSGMLVTMHHREGDIWATLCAP